MAADSGPTVVGSILGKLRMDRAQWEADVAKTKQDIRDLESASPNIRITDNAPTVVSRLAAVKTATDAVSGSAEKAATSQSKLSTAQARLTAAMSAADSAFARASLAQMRLNELREKGVTTGSRYVAAEIAVTEALKRLDAANEKVTASELALAAARRADSDATEADARATVAANEAKRTAFSRVGMITAAIAGLLPLLPPVGAAAVGVGGAFAGMGSAGVLALVGINREMKDGTETGTAYRAGVDSLKESMNTLARTSAAAMLASFQRVVRETNAALPALNAQVGQFSTLLGRSGGNLFAGTINTLRVLNPLFLTAGRYIEDLTAGFLEWTQGSGIEKFGAYAMSMLPRVTDTLGKLASAVARILEALAPMGTIGLALISGVADGINAIPVDVLTQLIVSVTGGAAAFAAWRFIAPMLVGIRDAWLMMSGAATVSTGAIGWVIAGLGALAGLLAVVIAKNNTATQSIQDYTSALDASGGAIDNNIRQMVAKALVDSDAMLSAKKLGVELSTVVDAALGQADALKQLSVYTKAADGDTAAMRKIVKDTGLVYGEAKVYVDTMVGSMRAESAALSGNATDRQLRIEALKADTAATREQQAAAKAQQAADEGVAATLGISVGVLQSARSAQGNLTDQTAKTTAEMYLQGDAAGLLKQALDNLNGKAQSAAETQNRFESQLVRMADAVKNNGTALYGMSEGAIENRRVVLDLIQSSEAAVTALSAQGASQDVITAKFNEQRQAIIDTATAQGMSTDEVTGYINELYKVPTSIPPVLVKADTSSASSTVQSFINSVSSRTIMLSFATQAPQGMKYPFTGNGANGMTARGLALGGTAAETMRGLANGGGSVIGPGTAGSDTAGIFRLANGEEVISNIFGQADRNRALLKQINAGYTPQAATVQAPSPPSRVVPNVSVYLTVLKNENPEVISNMVGRAVRRELAGMNR